MQQNIVLKLLKLFFIQHTVCHSKSCGLIAIELKVSCKAFRCEAYKAPFMPQYNPAKCEGEFALTV